MLPCKLCQCLDAICKGACNAMNKACAGCCKVINESCGGCKNAVKGCIAPIANNPLGTFVLGTWAFQLIIICACVYAISSLGDLCGLETTTSTTAAPGSRRLRGGMTYASASFFRRLTSSASSAYEDAVTEDDNQQSAVMLFCIIEIVFAIIHCVFAYYIQRRLIGRIMASEDSDTMSTLVWYLLKYDIGFCLYFFFAIAAPAYALSQAGDVAECTNSSANFGSGAAIFLACCYSSLEFFYMCCFVCGAGVQSKVSDLKARVDPSTIGAQATS